MNKRKITLVIASIIMAFMFVFMALPNKVKAATNISPIYFGVNEFRNGTTPNNMGYAIRNPYANGNTANAGAKIWQMVKYSSNSATGTYTTGNYYCVRAGVGFNDTTKVATYNIAYDFKDKTDAQNNTWVNRIISNGNYYKLQALTDLLYLPGVSTQAERANLMKNAYNDSNWQQYYNYYITDSDIEAVQQAAIWYFTNSDDTYGIYNNYDTVFVNGGNLTKTSWLFYRTSSMSMNNQAYTSLSDYGLSFDEFGDQVGPGLDRQEQAVFLYNYLIKTAIDNASSYQNGTAISRNQVTLYSNATNQTNTQPVILIEKLQETSVKVTKVWDDNNNQDGVRPTSVTVKLLADGSDTGKSITLNAGNNWTYTFTNLPAKRGSNTINYTVEETNVPTGYTLTTTGNATSGYTLTNKYTPGVTSVKVTKVWDDNNNQDGIRPTSVTIKLLGNGAEKQTITLDASNNWTYTFTNLPVKQNGNNITYTVQEVNVPSGYTLTTSGNAANGFTLTNKYTPGVTSVTVRKVWDDNNNQDGIRPNSISVRLLGNGALKDTVTLNASNNWTHTFTNLPAKQNGNAITYIVEEVNVPTGYTLRTSGNATAGYVLTNKYERQQNTYNLVLVKEDAEGEQLNSTATFVVNGETKTVTGRLTIAENVVINNSNVNTIDRYTIKETVPPDEYCPFDGTINIEVSKKKENGNFMVDEVNYTVTDSNGNDITESARNTANVYLNEDGNIYVEVKNYQFDLKLVKRIVEVNGTSIAERIQNVNVDKLANKTATTADYTLDKNPVPVKQGDIIKYTLRVYNEGEIDGYASEITEDIPEGLEFVWSEKEGTELDEDTTLTDLEKEAIRYNQGIWSFEDVQNNRVNIVTTDYLAKGKGAEIRTSGANLIKAFDKSKGYKNTINDKNPDYREVSVYMRVIAENSYRERIRNEAAITEDTDKDGNPVDDRDSDTEQWVKYEDDEDYDNVILQSFDLALRKFIIAVSEDETIENSEYLRKGDGTYTREPVVDTSKLNSYNENGQFITTAEYNHTKQPLNVNKNDIVVYMLRVYNEADIDGYATEITDYLPPYLTYVDGEYNNQYGWHVSQDGRKVTTNYLDSRIINKTTTNNDGKIVLSYREVPIMCKVTDDATGKITNIAEITECKDENKEDITDRDSETNNVVLPSDEDLPNYKDDEKGSYVPGQQDDDDFEKVVVQEEIPVEFDLALRKFIIGVSKDDTIEDSELIKNNDGTYSRAPIVDTSKLNTVNENRETITTATYKHSKVPVQVEKNDYVVYMFRVYNEADIDGYATEITDYLPPYLTYVDGEFNNQYGWHVSQDGRKVTTDYLKDSIVRKTTTNGNEIVLSYVEVPIMCKVTDDATGKITNIAEITECKDENKQPVTDRDSEPNNVVIPSDDELPEYKDNEKGEYIPGQQDDDDFEKVVIRERVFDLALRKFITKINDEDVKTRIPGINYDKATNKITYEHTKDPMDVRTDDIVIYTIRVYNEGDISGYASEVSDDMPEGLEFLPNDNTNKEYRWTMYDKKGKETNDVSKAVKIKTDYLSKEQGEERKEDAEENPALLKAFDRNAEISDDNPDYAEVKVAFKVKESNSSSKIIINSAQISDDTDEDGNPVEDVDSTPDKWNEGEDDQDKEYIKLGEFDLALRKWVTHAIVIENGKETVTQTGHKAEDNPEQVVKVELNRKKLTSLQVKFRYSIRVTNEGDIAGYAKEIKDYVPTGLKFVAADNTGWKDEGNNVISTRNLENTLLQPGQSAEVQVTLTWITGANNLGLKTNIAEISEDYNDRGVPDKDSTPNNKKDGEDDIDDAPVLLSISTGKVKIYLTLGLLVLVTIAGGVAGIKKYVL